MMPSNDDIQQIKTSIAVFGNDMKYMKEKLEDIDQKVSTGYVTKTEHDNVVRRIKLLEKIVYTAVGVILLAVLAAIVNSVVVSK